MGIRRTVEAYFNVLNQICIGMVTFYVTYYCYHLFPITFKANYHMHVWFCTIGYQLLMAESIMSLYSNNSWSIVHKSKTKRQIHCISQIVGSGMAIFGVAMLYYQRKDHFKHIHSITGLISLILAIIAGINGISALWSQNLYKKYRIKPVISKFVHNLVGIATFVMGMISLFYGYNYNYFMKLNPKMDISMWLMAAVIVTTILSLIGAITTLYNQAKNIIRFFYS